MSAERTIEEMLVSIGWGLGFSAAHDLLRPGASDGELERAVEGVAVELERAGLQDAAAAVRGGLADLRAGVHRHPARAEGLIEGVVRDVERLELERGA